MGPDKTIRLVMAALLALGVVTIWLNADLPLGRDASIHAQIARELEAHGFRAWEVCSDPAVVREHGCGFALAAAPLTRVFGLDLGLRLASFAGTAALLFAAVAFFRRFNRDVHLGPGDVPLELAITCANPIVIAQFWSACPDTLFAACALASFILLDRLLRDGQIAAGRTAALYTATLVLAVFVSPIGLAIYPLHALWGWWRWRELSRRRAALLIAMWSIAVAWVALAKLGWNPLLDLDDPRGEIAVPYLANVKRLALFGALVFGALAVVAAPRLAVTRRDGHLALALGGYLHLVLVSASVDNLGGYVAIIPFATLYVVRALGALTARRIRTAAFAVFAAAQIATIVASEVRQSHGIAAAVLPAPVLAGDISPRTGDLR